MSHTAKIRELQVNDLDALGRAAADIGLELVRGQKTYRTYSTQKCDHAIRIPGNAKAYEIGVVGAKDGNYDLMQDTFVGGNGMVAMVGGSECYKLKQSYAAQVALAHYQQEGWANAEPVRTEDGFVHLRFQN